VFERYTERARRVLFFARYEAGQRGDRTLAPEHLLLGLIRETKGIHKEILRPVDLEEVVRQIDTGQSHHEHVPASVEIPFAAEARDILELAKLESDDLKHNYIGTEHLLLALLRREGTRAAAILHSQGLTLEGAREQLASLMATHVSSPPELDADLKSLGRRPDTSAVLEQLAAVEDLVRRLVRSDDPDGSALHEAIVERIAAIRRLLR
jgi:ATP-dependent Clp protease ATP-binding subunit ClpC